MPKPILCLDFDGVVHSYRSGWLGQQIIPDPPVDGAEEAIWNYLYHFQVVIHSSRCTNDDGVAAIQDWMKRYLPMVADKVEVCTTKPPAAITLDDRAVTFNGAWPTTDFLIHFKPWHHSLKPEER